MIEVVVAGIGVVDPESNPLLLLKERDGERVLVLGIGPLEAHAIAIPLQGDRPPRPLTHDVLAQTIGRLGSHPERVEITNLTDGTFYARLVLEQPGNGGTIDIDIRPSDGVGLAVRTETPIYVAEAVMDEAGIVAELAGPGEASHPPAVEQGGPAPSDESLAPFREFIETLDVDDLGTDRPEKPPS